MHAPRDGLPAGLIPQRSAAKGRLERVGFDHLAQAKRRRPAQRYPVTANKGSPNRGPWPAEGCMIRETTVISFTLKVTLSERGLKQLLRVAVLLALTLFT